MNYVLIQIVNKFHSKFIGYVIAAYLSNLVIFINSVKKILENVMTSGRKSVTNSLPTGRPCSAEVPSTRDEGDAGGRQASPIMSPSKIKNPADH
jgi:hypothetical protein